MKIIETLKQKKKNLHCNDVYTSSHPPGLGDCKNGVPRKNKRCNLSWDDLGI